MSQGWYLAERVLQRFLTSDNPGVLWVQMLSVCVHPHPELGQRWGCVSVPRAVLWGLTCRGTALPGPPASPSAEGPSPTLPRLTGFLLLAGQKHTLGYWGLGLEADRGFEAQGSAQPRRATNLPTHGTFGQVRATSTDKPPKSWPGL